MTKILALGLVVVAVIIATNVIKSKASAPVTQPSAPTAQATPVATPGKFSDSANAKFANQIYPGPMTETAKAAMAGFDLQTVPQSDGSVKITLLATNPEYKTQIYAVKPGEKLYFIEKNLKDDDENTNTDKLMGDDTAVVVDAQDNIVPQN